jgi:hypothetical protein
LLQLPAEPDALPSIQNRAQHILVAPLYPAVAAAAAAAPSACSCHHPAVACSRLHAALCPVQSASWHALLQYLQQHTSMCRVDTH